MGTFMLTGSGSGALTGVTDAVGSLVSEGADQMVEFLGAITSNAVLTTFVIAVPLVGLGIGLLKRLIKTRG